jgi:acyl-CoA synthetase (AMP-forming)/AMP-acid ligase II
MIAPDDLLTFDEFLTHWAEHRPDTLALSADDRRWTYAELEEQTARVATYLLNAGLKKGDRIAWIGKNSDLYLILFYGAARIGVVMAPIGWRLAVPEWAFIVNDTQSKLVFTGADFNDAGDALSPLCPAVQGFVKEGDIREALHQIERMPFVPCTPQEAVLQLYTSGTTGNPKGVELSGLNLFGLRKQANASGLAYTQWDDDEVILIAMPIAHIGGTGLGVMALAAGLPGHVLTEFTPDGFFDAVEQHGVTRLFIVPAALHILLQHPRCATVDYSRLKYILYGAAPMPLELLRQCITMFNAGFIQAYGMTETSGTIVSLPPEDHDPAGNKRMRSAGKPLPGVEVKVVDGAGNDLPTGEVGEIITRSSNNMIGYWNLPDATAKTMTDDGWVHTGDAGYLDEDGYVYIHDRVKDMIISGGENIYPAEVESAIYGHPDVLEVAVVGVPDEKWGEAVKAICVPRPGCAVDSNSVVAWTREKIAGYKVPKTVDVIDALPRNASGKILRRELRAPYWAGYDRQVN